VGTWRALWIDFLRHCAADMTLLEPVARALAGDQATAKEHAIEALEKKNFSNHSAAVFRRQLKLQPGSLAGRVIGRVSILLLQRQ